MKVMFIIILLSLFVNISFSQKKSGKIIIDAKYECSYMVRYIEDTIKMIPGTEDRFLLIIGNELSYEYSYLMFRWDSIYNLGTHHFSTTFTESIKNGTLSSFFGSHLWSTKIYKLYKEKKIKVLDNISAHRFIYEEQLLPQTWRLQDDTMTIQGFSCQNAICNYRGRDFEAWFTPEIPISEGPWKFFGLPGLILKLYDVKRHYEFELVEFKKTDKTLNIKDLYEKSIQKIGRKEFLQIKFGERGNFIISKDMEKLGISYEPVSKNYKYIELDY